MSKNEINIGFLSNYNSKKELLKSDFEKSKNLFTIFDTDGDDKLSSSEIKNIFQQIVVSADKNMNDTRENQYTILDNSEAEHFISNNKDKYGKIYKELGVTVSEVFEFIRTLLNNFEFNDGSDNIIGSKSSAKESDDTVDNEIVERANMFINVPERGDEQFSEKERIALAELSEAELVKARQLFHVDSRTKQLSADDIIMIVTGGYGKFKIKDENYEKLEMFLALKNSANMELSAEDIARLMTLPSEKIDSAIKLLTLNNRKEFPLLVIDIVNIINCDSPELIKAVIENPNLKDFEKTSAESLYWITMKDSENNITYRYIKGQQYPEEISEERISSDSFRRTVYNRNLNIQQILIYNDAEKHNPVKMETRHLSATGDVEYIEVLEQGNNPGTPDIYITDSAGNKTYLQQTVTDEQTGAQIVRKIFTDDKGNLTNFSYSITNEDEYHLTYEVKDSQGNSLYNKELKLRKTGENTYEYTKDNKTYSLKLSNDSIVITDKSDNTSYTINYSDYIAQEDNPDIFRQNILKIPADVLIFLSKNPLSLSYGTKDVENQAHCREDHRAIDIGTITKTHYERELNDSFITILIHELGHYIDNPNPGTDDISLLSQNEDFIRIYREEMDAFCQHHSSEEQMIISQFNGIGYQSKSKDTQLQRSLSETFAESNMVTTTNSKSWTSARSYYLQRYFPRTIQKAQELLDARISQ